MTRHNCSRSSVRSEITSLERSLQQDHLNTPRLVANQSGQTVWRWEQQEPFGVSVPDENPSGLGAFEFPLRFPGQYADKETNLTYNVRRDYDAVLGRYVQSDPLGVGAGVNTFLYAKGNPLKWIDPLGLCAASPDMLKCLKDIFDQNVDWVKVTVDPAMVYWHLGEGVQGAVTRPQNIYISMSCDEFWSGSPWFILHEYYHVVEQWAKGMTILSYIFSFKQKEKEANDFATQNQQKLKQCLTPCKN